MDSAVLLAVKSRYLNGNKGQMRGRFADKFVELQKHPVDGFSAGLVDDDNMLEWDIVIMGYITSS